MTDYEDQYAVAVNFLIRGFAREAVSSKLFMAGLAPEQRTRVREEGLARLRGSAAEFILGAICSVIQSGGKPANAPPGSGRHPRHARGLGEQFPAAGSGPRDRTARRPSQAGAG